ncbi:hypothetical protein KIL84_004444 [Mauremys mutica]|uniref:Uncharacterized protein n=1 Tax=Mauremys mutica TaxID=74926 RepID=A0A9D4B013_9SAUR|nr:hypothetical protein KIL84_004444 [Mauremys mutica]
MGTGAALPAQPIACPFPRPGQENPTPAREAARSAPVPEHRPARGSLYAAPATPGFPFRGAELPWERLPQAAFPERGKSLRPRCVLRPVPVPVQASPARSHRSPATCASRQSSPSSCASPPPCTGGGTAG